jgi:hypothetical protein
MEEREIDEKLTVGFWVEQYIKDNNVEKGVLPDEVAEDLFKTAIVNWSYYLHNPLKSLYKKEGKLLQCKINSKSG